jgi:hypothetical protein
MRKNKYLFIEGVIRDFSGQPIERIKMPLEKSLCYFDIKYGIKKPKKNPYKGLL